MVDVSLTPEQESEAQRLAALIGVKYYNHPAGDPVGADRPPDELVRMTMLVSQGR